MFNEHDIQVLKKPIIRKENIYLLNNNSWNGS